MIAVHVHPRAKANRVEQASAGKFNVWLTSAPHDGQANDQLIRLFSKHFAIAKSQIRIVRGQRSRIKTIEIS
jgi:uncharacterized protein